MKNIFLTVILFTFCLAAFSESKGIVESWLHGDLSWRRIDESVKYIVDNRFIQSKLSEPQIKTIGFYHSTFEVDVTGESFFLLFGDDESALQYIDKALKNLKDTQGVQPLIKLVKSSLMQLDKEYDLILSKPVDVPWGGALLPAKPVFTQFLQRLAKSPLSTKQKQLALFRYIIAMDIVLFVDEIQRANMVAFVNKRSSKPEDKKIASSAPVRAQSPLANFIDDKVGKDNFYAGLGILSTWGMTIASDKAYSMATGRPFDGWHSAVYSTGPAIIMAMTYLIKKALNDT